MSLKRKKKAYKFSRIAHDDEITDNWKPFPAQCGTIIKILLTRCNYIRANALGFGCQRQGEMVENEKKDTKECHNHKIATIVTARVQSTVKRKCLKSINSDCWAFVHQNFVDDVIERNFRRVKNVAHFLFPIRVILKDFPPKIIFFFFSFFIHSFIREPN